MLQLFNASYYSQNNLGQYTQIVCNLQEMLNFPFQQTFYFTLKCNKAVQNIVKKAKVYSIQFETRSFQFDTRNSELKVVAFPFLDGAREKSCVNYL